LCGAHVQPYIDLTEGLNTWRAQDYVSSSKTAEHFNRPHVELQTCKHGRYDRRKNIFYWRHKSEAGKQRR
jgi:hypothetical protein